LFEAYLLCKDQDFVTYIRRQKQELYIDATITVTPDILMERALKQYQIQVQEKTRGVGSTNRKNIMSLTARMDKQEEVTNQKVTNHKHDDEVKAEQNATGNNSKQKWTEWKDDKTPSRMKKAPLYSGERKFEQGYEYS
jgi:hypothetical protein